MLSAHTVQVFNTGIGGEAVNIVLYQYNTGVVRGLPVSYSDSL